MPSSRGCRSSYDCIVKIKGVTTRPILFSQLMRSDGEGAMNPEELFADDRSPASEQQRVHEDELHSLMRSILDWAISFLSEPSQGTIRALLRGQDRQAAQRGGVRHRLRDLQAPGALVSRHQGDRPRGIGGARRRDARRARGHVRDWRSR